VRTGEDHDKENRTSYKLQARCRSSVCSAHLIPSQLYSCRHNETGEVSPGETAYGGPQIEAAENVFVRGGNNYVHLTYKPEVKMVEEAQVDASLLGISTR